MILVLWGDTRGVAHRIFSGHKGEWQVTERQRSQNKSVSQLLGKKEVKLNRNDFNNDVAAS